MSTAHSASGAIALRAAVITAACDAPANVALPAGTRYSRAWPQGGTAVIGDDTIVVPTRSANIWMRTRREP